MENKFYSGCDDRNGVPICHGDIVEYHFSAIRGYSKEKSPEYTEMIDVCQYDAEDNSFYLYCELMCGSYVFRHSDKCKVIGDIYENADLLKHFKYEDLVDLFPNVF